MAVKIFHLHKAGNSPGEYEDAARAEPERRRFAIADGATESTHAGCWAGMLVEDFARSPVANPIKQWPSRLPGLQQRWAQEVQGQELSWYAEAKLEQGAAATFLGLDFEESSLQFSPPFWRRKSWRALAVGDCCLFQIRQAHLLISFPIKSSTEFGNTPALVSSCQPDARHVYRRRCQKRNGTWRWYDRFWLMTDALAQWFLREHEASADPITQIKALLGQDEQSFNAWVERQRTNGTMRNDDVTLVAIRAVPKNGCRHAAK